MDEELTDITTLFHREHGNLYRHLGKTRNMVHKAAPLCKADANPENPMLSFSLQVHFSQDAPTQMHAYIHTHKNHFWAQRKLLMILNLYIEPQGIFHLPTDERRNRCSSPSQSSESRETFCDSLILLHECENGVRKIWLKYFFEKAHLVKIKTMTHKLPVVIYRSILKELRWTGGKKRHKILKGKEEWPVHSASSSLSWAKHDGIPTEKGLHTYSRKGRLESRLDLGKKNTNSKK